VSSGGNGLPKNLISGSIIFVKGGLFKEKVLEDMRGK
jgi:hypothetical protein